MIQRALIILLLSGGLALAEAPASKREPLPEGLQRIKYNGWTNSLVLEAADALARAIVTPLVGGRVSHYSINGDNILFENPAAFGKTLASDGPSLWLGGFQSELGPSHRPPANLATLTLGPYQWKAEEDYSLSLASEADPVAGFQMGKDIMIDPETGALGITQWIRNVASSESTLCLQDRTLCKPEGYALIPVNRRSRFPSKWTLQPVSGSSGSEASADSIASSVRLLDNVLVIKTGGSAARIGSDPDAGWIAYARGRLLFVKFFPHEARAAYAGDGCTAGVYFDRSVTEFGPISPEVTLKPGATYAFPEQWILITLKETVNSFEKAKALTRRIPDSPFQGGRAR